MALGISIYPEKSTMQKDMDYIELASKYGFSRIFTCLLSVCDEENDEIIQNYKKIIAFAHKFNMEVILDVSTAVFEKFNITYDNLKFFYEIGADGIRIDESLGAFVEAIMTYNEYNLIIEVNSSFGSEYLANIMSHSPRYGKITTCFNFYPQKYSGLSFEHFLKCANQVKLHNLKNAVFVSSQNENTFAPWEIKDGLCTLEMHRNLPIDVQIRHLYALGLIDDIIIANAYASKEEFEAISKCKSGVLTFKIDFQYDINDIEKELIYEHLHYIRGDMSSFFVRSTMPRITYKDAEFKPFNTTDLKRGDIVIVNENYTRYKGELQIILEDMPNDGDKNVVGKIPENEIILLDFLKPWRVFEFV